MEFLEEGRPQLSWAEFLKKRSRDWEEFVTAEEYLGHEEAARKLRILMGNSRIQLGDIPERAQSQLGWNLKWRTSNLA